MFLVTGAKRSGTSMWMQILTAAGLPAVGEAFPKSWGDGPLREANPRGFFESTLRDGIAWHTNPDPRTGFYLHPDAARGHCVKVFLPGLARTDLAFVEGALLTVRDWRTRRPRSAGPPERTCPKRRCGRRQPTPWSGGWRWSSACATCWPAATRPTS